jgi:putative pyoverdin transport system ATP-binding/permease protein
MNAFTTFATASVALQNLETLGLAKPDNEDDSSNGSNSDISREPWLHLELVGVTHNYPSEEAGERFVLGPLDLTFQPGSIIFIAGGNGSGKTTLVKLLAGLYTPESGEIRLNYRPVHDDTREQYRQYFSVLFSDFFLFEELVCPYDDEGDIKARDYLARLQLSHKVQVTNGDLSTTRLSQGQRKRLALLSAYMEDRQIYIFDEWAADQDPIFRETFYCELLPELKAKRKTVFVISHDDRYYHLADRLIKLEYGHVEQDCVPNTRGEAGIKTSNEKSLEDVR